MKLFETDAPDMEWSRVFAVFPTIVGIRNGKYVWRIFEFYEEKASDTSRPGTTRRPIHEAKGIDEFTFAID